MIKAGTKTASPVPNSEPSDIPNAIKASATNGRASVERDQWTNPVLDTGNLDRSEVAAVIAARIVRRSDSDTAGSESISAEREMIEVAVLRVRRLGSAVRKQSTVDHN